MNKVDVKKELKALYRPPAKEVVQVDVPPMNFLMIDGAGDPRGLKGDEIMHCCGNHPVAEKT